MLGAELCCICCMLLAVLEVGCLQHIYIQTYIGEALNHCDALAAFSAPLKPSIQLFCDGGILLATNTVVHIIHRHTNTTLTPGIINTIKVDVENNAYVVR